MNWKHTIGDGGELRWSSLWDEVETKSGQFQTAVSANKQPLVLSRTLTPKPEERWLLGMAEYWPQHGSAPKLEIRVDGETVEEFEVARRDKDHRYPTPIFFPLAPYQGSEIHLEIVQLAIEGSAPVIWKSIQLVEQTPLAYALLEDTGEFAPVEETCSGRREVGRGRSSFGKPLLSKLHPMANFGVSFQEPIAIRREPDWGEYRYIRFCVSKVWRRARESGTKSHQFSRAAHPL